MAETGSTNADLLVRAASGAPEGLWLRAERQSAGRGRLSRAWQSVPGNLHASTLVRLRSTDPPASTLAFVAAIAAYDMIASEVPTANTRLKWPNDVLIDNTKCAGALLERAGDAVVVGFGVNVAFAPSLPDRETISLAAAGADPRRGSDLLVFDLASHFAGALADWRAQGAAAILQAWLARAHPVGSRLAVSDAVAGRVEGTFRGLAEDGALVLDTASGLLAVRAGDIDLLNGVA